MTHGEDGKASHQNYASFTIMCCLWLTVGMNNASVAWTLKDISESQELDLRQESLVVSGFAMGYCLGPVTMGVLLDKLGRRPTLLLCCIVPSLCQAATAALSVGLAKGWAFALALSYLRCCQGLCSGGATMSSKVYLNETLPPSCRDAMMSMVHTQLQLGGIVLTIAALFWHSWQQLHAVLAVPGLVTFLLLLSPELCPESLAQRSEDPGLAELLRPPLRRRVAALVANQFFHRLCQQGNDAWGMKSLDTDFRAMVSSVKFICKILGGLLAASASQRLGTLPVLLGGYMTCSVGTLAFAMANEKMSLSVAWGVANLGEEVANVLAMTSTVQAFPKHLRGRGVSLVSAPTALAGVFAGSLGTLSAHNPKAPFLVTASSMVLSGSILLLFSGCIFQPCRPAEKQD
ncbi:unnamed protein product [Effrenium voratum]|uniref:Major facilitator superfamily (MFS) profile domain-containing protein n=1 Tax=Effrenium voratum TaxID=2562239 RepID=A0AA36HMU9_9DINO|nr:unnamed protein product [Effrenium voratum]CAJ1416668.1 unnamed protein product [Effrenium voratum]